MGDTDADAVNFFHVLKREPLRVASCLAGLLEQWQRVPKEVFVAAVDELLTGSSEFNRAIAFYIHRRAVWSQAQCSRRASAYSPSRAEKALILPQLRRLPVFARLLENVEIYCESYELTLERVEGVPNVFVPLDPPYFGKDWQLYACHFDHVKFRRDFGSLRHPAMLMLDTSPEALKMYDGYLRCFWPVTYAGNVRRPGEPKPKAIEQVIFNYEPPFFHSTVRELGWMTEEEFTCRRLAAANDNEPLA